MKVAYDISILGQGYINPKARTGIYRVVESLFLELVKRQDIQIEATVFNGLSNIWDNTSSSLYIKNISPQFQQQFKSCYYSRFQLQPIYEKAAKLQKTLINTAFKKVPWLYKPALAMQIPFKSFAKLDVFVNSNHFSNFDLYHTPFLPMPPNVFLTQIPKIITIYDMIPFQNPENFNLDIYRKFQAIITSIEIDKDFVICISENTKLDFCNYTGMNPNRVFVTPLAAAEHFYPVTNSETIDSTLQRYQIPNAPYLLSICTLEPRKNLSFLIRCFSEIIADRPNLNINLVLVGVSGWKNSDIFEEAKKNPSLKSRIIFTGYIPDEDLSPIYSGATAFVYPSLYEGFGLPPLEAMQCGTPVITSNTSSLPEVVGNAGITIAPTKNDELCDSLLKVINNSDLRANLSQRGIERAKQFSWARCAEETVKVYRTAVNS